MLLASRAVACAFRRDPPPYPLEEETLIPFLALTGLLLHPKKDSPALCTLKRIPPSPIYEKDFITLREDPSPETRLPFPFKEGPIP